MLKAYSTTGSARVASRSDRGREQQALVKSFELQVESRTTLQPEAKAVSVAGKLIGRKDVSSKAR